MVIRIQISKIRRFFTRPCAQIKELLSEMAALFIFLIASEIIIVVVYRTITLRNPNPTRVFPIENLFLHEIAFALGFAIFFTAFHWVAKGIKKSIIYLGNNVITFKFE